MADDPTPSFPPDDETRADPLMHGATHDGTETGGAEHGAVPGAGNRVSPAVGRYEMLGEIARGGMGVIYRAIDTSFGREVAVKVLPERFAPASGAAIRFLGEARITGQLQHPAIPPAHDLGTLPDGRPYLAMKLIRGRTLDQLLKDRPEPATDRGRFVAIYEQICQAVAYAHDHRVIHRDLKPANVMVGNYGEVQVMDWGLAKVLGGTDSAAGPREATNAPSGTEIHSFGGDESLTQAGSVLGTPAYMPPEQAACEIGNIDERADVFGLGAVLAVILTGEPPYVGETVESVRRMAIRGDLTGARSRLDACGAEPELVALCTRCLSFSPADRPPNALAVATAVAGLRAAAEDRARRAQMEQAKAQVRATEARKKRRVQFMLAALMVLTVLGAAAGWAIDQRRRARAATEEAERRARASSSVAAALEEARVRTEEAWGQTNYPDRMQVAGDFATAAVRRAEEFVAGGDLTPELMAEFDATRAAVGDLVRHVRLISEAARIYFEHADSPNPGSGEDRAASARQLATAFRAFGLDPGAQSEADAARVIVASRARDKLLGFLAEWIFWTRDSDERRRIRGVFGAVRTSAGGLLGRWQGITDRNDTAALIELARSTEAMTLSVELIGELVRQLDQAGRPSDCLDLLRRASDRYPDQIWLHHSISHRCLRVVPARTHEAAKHAAAMVVLRPTSHFCHHHLGRCLVGIGAHELAVRSFRKSIELNPRYVYPHSQLGALLASGKASTVDPADLEAIRTDPRYAPTHVSRGNVLRGNNDLDGAVAAYRTAIRLDPNHAPAHGCYGDQLLARNDLDGAIREFRDVVRILPKSAHDRNKLASALARKGDLDGAIVIYKEAIGLDPKFVPAHGNLGAALVRKGHLDAAVVACREALRLDPKYAPAHNILMIASRDKGDLDAAIASCQAALDLNPMNAAYKSNLAQLQRWRELLPRLQELADGRAEPTTPAEALEFIDLCRQPFLRRYVLAARLYTGAFAADPNLAKDLTRSYRYAAARCAILAASGRDAEMMTFGAEEWSCLTDQARAWLLADLGAWAARSKDPRAWPLIRSRLTNWKKDVALTTVRDPAWLAAMPPADRNAWRALWVDVDALLVTLSPALAPPPHMKASGAHD